MIIAALKSASKADLTKERGARIARKRIAKQKKKKKKKRSGWKRFLALAWAKHCIDCQEKDWRAGIVAVWNGGKREKSSKKDNGSEGTSPTAGKQ